MRIDGVHYRSIWETGDGSVTVIDQKLLPFAFETVRIASAGEAAAAIRDMTVRGAPLIGATGAYGLVQAIAADPSDAAIAAAWDALHATRPAAINLRWALDGVRRAALAEPGGRRHGAALAAARAICDDDVATCEAIGRHGLELIRAAEARAGGGRTVNILTHCNAGWLATVDWGTALAPIYKAHDAGIPVHVWVDETRPRNQGAALTAWELGRHGVPHTVIVDNAGGHLMQRGLVDLCIVGTDRTAANGDVCNKIGTYLKALAAHDNGVPFYVALPHSTIDWTLDDGVAGTPIEERAADEVTLVHGRDADGRRRSVTIVPDGTPAANFAFDVTPARLVTALVTERGVAAASRDGLLSLYPERAERAA